MSDLIAHGERLDVYDEPDGAEPPAPEQRNLEPNPIARQRADLRPGRRVLAQSAPVRLFGVFLGGMATGGLFLALGFWAGHRARPARLDPDHPSLASPSLPTKLDALSSTASAETAAAKPGATVQVDQGTRAKPDSAAPMTTSKPPSAPKSDRGFQVQVASPATQQEAEDLARILKNMGYPVLPTASAPPGAERKLFRVRVGPYPTRAEAQQAVARLQLEGFTPRVEAGVKE